MKIKLVSHTMPTEALVRAGIENPANLIAYCARVSNPQNQLNTGTADKLTKFLIKHKHWSPLEMVDATFEIETTRDIARQMLRHRSFCFQEFSQRYAEATEFEVSEARLQDTTNRQNSIEVADENLQEWWDITQRLVWKACEAEYKRALDKGIAKELARKLLPEGLTVSRLYMKGSLRSWIHYIELRSAHGTQKEHALIAQGIGEIISKLFPVSWQALTETNNDEA